VFFTHLKGKPMNNNASAPQWPNLTPSRAGDLACLKKYHELHVLKNSPGEAFSPALVYGQASHDLLKRVYNPAVAVSPAQADVSLLSQRVFSSLSYPDRDLRDKDCVRCAQMVQAYVSQDTDATATIAVEIFAKTPVSNAAAGFSVTLGAKFDRLIKRPDEADCLVVRDYKTGKPGAVDMEGACLMLAVARKCYPQFKTAVVEFDWIAEGGLAQRAVITIPEAKEVWKDLRTAAFRVYGATEFPAEPGEHCQFCPLQTECRPEPLATIEEIDALFNQY
jgi:RecB family exonuclease